MVLVYNGINIDISGLSNKDVEFIWKTFNDFMRVHYDEMTAKGKARVTIVLDSVDLPGR